MKQETFDLWWSICSMIAGVSSLIILFSVCMQAWSWILPFTVVCTIGLVGRFILIAIKRHETKEAHVNAV